MLSYLTVPGPGHLLVWITGVQGPTALAAGAAEIVWSFFLSSLSSFSLSLGDGPI